MCSDTGAVVAVSYASGGTGGQRPVLARAVVFLASGDTLWLDGTLDGGTRGALTVRERDAAQYDLRLSARATLLTGAARLTDGAAAAGAPVPVGLELTLEPASQRLALGAGDVTLVRGGGSLSAGSVVHQVAGTAWSASGPDGVPGGRADCRVRAVFQDGSALFLAGASAAAGAGPSAGGVAGEADVVAALVHNTRIRATEVSGLASEEAVHGLAGRSVSWVAAGRAPAGARGQVRDPQQQVTVTGAGALSWNCAPYVFVRQGVTGLGVVERVTREDGTGASTGASDELPDPY